MTKKLLNKTEVILEELNNKSKQELLDEINLLKEKITGYEAIMQSPDNVLIFSLDTDFKYIAYNNNHVKEMKKVWGAEITVGMSLPELITVKELRDLAIKSFNRVLKGETFSEIQFQPNADIWYELFWSPIFMNNTIIGLTCFVQDITSRKKAEADLFKSEQQFRLLNQVSPIGIYMTDINGNCVYVNDVWCEMAGLTPEEANGNGWVMGIHPDDRELIKSSWDKMIKSEGKWGLEYRFMNKEGKITWVHGLAVKLQSQGNEHLGYMGTNIDITKRKKTENALKKSENTLSTLMSNLSGMAYRCKNDEYYTMLFVNDACEQLTGYKPDQIINNKEISYGEIIYSEDIDKVRKHVDSINIQNRHFELEYRIVTAAGQLKWVWERGTQSTNNEIGETILEGVIHDISDRIKAEEALRESEEKYRLLAQNSIDVIWQMTLDLKFTFVSPSITKLTGYTIDEWIGTKLSSHSSSKEFFNMGRKALMAIKKFKLNDYLTFETAIFHKNGNEIPIEITGQVLFNEEEKPIGLQGSVKNISERKKNESELLKYREHLEELVKDRTKELEEKNKELDKFNQLFIGREFRIKELRDKVKALEALHLNKRDSK